MDPEIQTEICDLFKLRNEHALISQTEVCVFHLAEATTVEAHIDVFLKIDAIINQALRLQLEV